MKALIAAIAVVFALGAALPAQAEARAPQARKAWGCYFTIKVPGFFVYKETGSVFGSTHYWGAASKYGGCDRKRTLIVKYSLMEYVADGPNIVRKRYQSVVRMRPKGSRASRWSRTEVWRWASWRAGQCPLNQEPPWEVGPFFLRMVFERKYHPGKVVLRTRNVNTPCENYNVDLTD
ncbi:MAG: hypothetical protein ACC726_00810 [Chloroflexota bacterium]